MYLKDATYSTRDRHCVCAPFVLNGVDVHTLVVMAFAVIAWYVLNSSLLNKGTRHLYHYTCH
jgi:hypothetical protein